MLKDILVQYRERAGNGEFLYTAGDFSANPDMIISIPTANVGLGNPRFCYSICDILNHLIYTKKEFLLGKNIWILGELADTENNWANWLSDKFLKGGKRDKILSEDGKYNTLEGYLRDRGELGFISTVKSGLGSPEVFRPYAKKIMEIADSIPITVIGAHEWPVIILKNYAERNKAANLTVGLSFYDAIEKPGTIRLKGFPEFLWHSSIYTGEHEYGKYLPSYNGKSGRNALLEISPLIFSGTPLPIEALDQRKESMAERWDHEKSITSTLEAYCHVEEPKELLAAGMDVRPIRIGVIPSGSGLRPSLTEKLARQAAPYIKKGVISMYWLATQADMRDIISNNSDGRICEVSSEYAPLKPDVSGCRVLNNSNSTAQDKAALIRGGHSIALDVDLLLGPGGDQYAVAEELGVPFGCISVVGYNEVLNAAQSVRYGTGIFLSGEVYDYVSDALGKDKNPQEVRPGDNIIENAISMFLGDNAAVMQMCTAFKSSPYENRYTQEKDLSCITAARSILRYIEHKTFK